MLSSEQKPFEELPEALVDEMISQSGQVGDILYQSFELIQRQRHALRKKLEESGFLKRDSELGYPPIPTTCGVDGSYAIERLLSTDLVALGGVAVEGLTPPSEIRYWERPHHNTLIQPVAHNPDTGTVARAVMIAMECELAHKAPHEVVFLDGSLTTPLIYLNQGLNMLQQNPGSELKDAFLNPLEKALAAYKTILTAPQTDRVWVGMPKYTTLRELGKRLNWPTSYDDRALLTLITEPGEFTSPVGLEQPAQPWHLNLSPASGKVALASLRAAIITALGRLLVLYYRPHPWTPALRLEVASSIAENQHRLALLLQALKHQCSTPSILEPFPLYMADRMVKHLGRAISAFRQVATLRMADQYKGDIGEIFFAMHGYRTEAGG